MTCVDGMCIDVPPEDAPGTDEDNDVSSVATQSDSVGGGGLRVGAVCPEGQIFQYGVCHTPVPDSHYNSPHAVKAEGCHTNHGNVKPISRWFILIWIGVLAFYLVMRAKED